MPLLEKLHVRGWVQESSFYEPFYHQRLRSLVFSCSIPAEVVPKPTEHFTDFVVEQLAFSLPALETLYLYWTHAWSELLLLELFVGFPRLKEVGSRHASMSISAQLKRMHKKGIRMPRQVFVYPPY